MSSRLRYYGLRSLKTVFLLWLVLTVLFVFFRSMPGSFADFMLNAGATEEAVRALEERWGLTDPLHEQYWRYLVNFVTLDAGQSLRTSTPVFEYVAPKILNSLVLAVPAITVGYVVGGSLGSYIGTTRDSVRETGGIVFVTFLGSFPGFFVGIVLILVFSLWLDIFPVSGMLSAEVQRQFAGAPWWRPYLTADFAWHYFLPFVTVFFRTLMAPTLVMRTSIVEVMGQDFSYFQKVSGLPYLRRIRHLGRHAILPLITLYPITVVRSISGLVLIETVFNWPGVGFTLVSAVQARDFPVVQFIFFVVAALVIISNFGIDILYGVIDPRVSVEEH